MSTEDKVLFNLAGYNYSTEDEDTIKPKKKQKKEYVMPEINTIKDLLKFAYEVPEDYTNGVDVIKILSIEKELLELDTMIGMKLLKESIIDMIMFYTQDHPCANDEYLHTVICGSAGHGKTEISKLIGNIFSNLGILPTNKFRTLRRDDFIGKYLGHTAAKTLEVLTSCLGGVAFFDEAYAIAPRDTDRDSFSKEAIDTLNQFLSEHKKDFVFIIAGYEEELDKTFFAMNQGLKRRFPWKFIIEEYTPEELLQIFTKMVRDIYWKIDVSAIEPKLFKDNKEYFKYAGGDIEIFLTKCKFASIKRCFGRDCQRELLTKIDIEKGLASHIKHKQSTKKDGKPPEMMFL